MRYAVSGIFKNSIKGTLTNKLMIISSNSQAEAIGTFMLDDNFKDPINTQYNDDPTVYVILGKPCIELIKEINE